MLTLNPAKRPREELAVLERRHVAFVAERRALAGNPPDAADVDARIRHADDVAGLDRKIEIAVKAIEEKRAELMCAEAAAAEKLANARHAEMEKKAAAERKLVLRTEASIKRLMIDLAALSEHRTEFDIYNGERGPRPYVANAETLVRSTPSVTVPAVFEERELWVDEDGQTPREFRQDPRTGEMAPWDQRAFTKKRVRVQVQAERFTPARTPESYTRAIRLYDRAGRQVWPPQ